jgi:hypothetical protein
MSMALFLRPLHQRSMSHNTSTTIVLALAAFHPALSTIVTGRGLSGGGYCREDLAVVYQNNSYQQTKQKGLLEGYMDGVLELDPFTAGISVGEVKKNTDFDNHVSQRLAMRSYHLIAFVI